MTLANVKRHRKKTSSSLPKWWQDHRHLPQEQAHFFSKLERWREQMVSVEKQNLKNALRRLYAQEETHWNRKKESFVRTKAIDSRRRQNARGIKLKTRANDKACQSVVVLPAILSTLHEAPDTQPHIASAESNFVQAQYSGTHVNSNHGHTLKEVLNATPTETNGLVPSPMDIVISRLKRPSRLPRADEMPEPETTNSFESIDHTVISQQQRLQKALNAQAPAEDECITHIAQHNAAREQELYRGTTVGLRLSPPSDNKPLHLFVLPTAYGLDWRNGSLQALDEQYTKEREYTVPATSPVEWSGSTPKDKDKIRLVRNVEPRGARIYVSPLDHVGGGIRYMAQPPEPFAIASCLIYPARARPCKLTSTNYRDYFDTNPSKKAKKRAQCSSGAAIKLPHIPQEREPSHLDEFRRSVASFCRPSRERTIDSVESSYNQLEANRLNRARAQFGAIELARLQESMQILDRACEVGLRKGT